MTKRPSTNDPKHSPTLPEGQGESRRRRDLLAQHGGVPLTKELEDGEVRGADEEGNPTTGTHGGPSKPPSKRA